MAFHSNFIIIHEYKEVKAIPMLTNASIINESFTFSGIVICVHHLIRLLISITFFMFRIYTLYGPFYKLMICMFCFL